MTSLDEVTLHGDDMEVVLLPQVGARIHRIRAFGADLLRTPADPSAHIDEPFFWGAYPMAPWCNRAPAGLTEVAGRTTELAANFDDGTAIHGLVAAASWAKAEDGSLRVAAGGDGWPWPHEVTLVPSVSGSTLTLDYRLANLSDAPMPAGIGLHPWFRKPVEVRLPADAAYDANSSSPAEPDAVSGPFDLRALGMPSNGLDATWTRFREARVDLRWPDLGVRASVEFESRVPSRCVALASPASVDAVAIEPQTHGPDPLRRLARGEPDAPILLPPSGTLRLTIRVTVARETQP